MTWQNIPWHVIKYFAMSLEICHVEKNQEYSMTWHRIFLKILSCSNEQAHVLTRWCHCTRKKKLIILQHLLHLIISFNVDSIISFDTIQCHSWNCLNHFSYRILIGIISRIVQGWPYEKLQFKKFYKKERMKDSLKPPIYLLLKISSLEFHTWVYQERLRNYVVWCCLHLT